MAGLCVNWDAADPRGRYWQGWGKWSSVQILPPRPTSERESRPKGRLSRFACSNAAARQDGASVRQSAPSCGISRLGDAASSGHRDRGRLERSATSRRGRRPDQRTRLRSSRTQVGGREGSRTRDTSCSRIGPPQRRCTRGRRTTQPSGRASPKQSRAATAPAHSTWPWRRSSHRSPSPAASSVGTGTSILKRCPQLVGSARRSARRLRPRGDSDGDGGPPARCQETRGRSLSGAQLYP